MAKVTGPFKARILQEQIDNAEEMEYRTGLDLTRYRAALEATPDDEEVKELIDTTEKQNKQWAAAAAEFRRMKATMAKK